ncbi:MAG: ECF-type sigma factor [Phycisphaerales bacterium]
MATDPVRDEAGEITLLLRVASRDDPQAMARLFQLVHDELLKRASQRLAQLPPWRSLDPPELVSEFFMKLFKGERPDFASREHFYRVASKVMRWILADRAKRARSEGRGRDWSRVPLTEGVEAASGSFNLLELSDALDELERVSPERAWLVELRFFAGLRDEAIAELMGLSTATVGRRWQATKAWLVRRLGHGDVEFQSRSDRPRDR